MLSGSITFNEANGKIDQLKTLSIAKSAFLQEVDIKEWDIAERKLPDSTKEDVIVKFNIQKGKPLPRAFLVSAIIICC